MAHIRGLWVPGCLALAVLFSLVHSQHGKRGLEAGTGWQAGIWAHGPGSPGLTENNRANAKLGLSLQYRARGRSWVLRSGCTVTASLLPYGEWDIQ